MPGISRKLQDKAAALVDSLAKDYISKDGSGSFSSVTYDTAWVSMVQKEERGGKRWRFPECFQYLLDTQGTDGGWGSGRRIDETDGILNSMVALLSFKKHMAEPSNCAIPDDIDLRAHKAKALVQSKLNSWDVESSDHVGLEILVPTILQLLESEGIRFEIPGLQTLIALNIKKLGKFDLQQLYGPSKDTMHHSLEAFVGSIDFDKLSHHKVSGSMMLSPSSTSAYLMYSSRWDEDAEQYLSKVIAQSSGKGTGGVPSAFPTQVFELSWVLSTLILSGFTADQLGLENVSKIGDFLDGHLHAGQDVLGFAPDVLSDADDTAKTILSLNLIGRSASMARMIAEFEADDHFKTYTMERNPSFSANCNVLNSLLYMPDPSLYVDQISKAAVFICNCCWEGTLKDKWNVSSQYCAMLASQVLMRLLRVWDSGQLSGLQCNFLRDKVPIVLFQIMMKALQDQDSAGSWDDGSFEISAYAVLTLVYLWPLPWATCIRERVRLTIESGRLFLCRSLDTTVQPEPIWIEKVLYGSSVLCETYILAALNAPVVDSPWGEAAMGLTNVTDKSVEKFLQFFTRLPLFSSEPSWELRASLTEGYLFLPLLKRRSREIFPRNGMDKDMYLEYIPSTWTTINRLKKSHLSADLLQEMMVVSMLNYQVDEYMEAVIGKHYSDNLQPVKGIIGELCKESEEVAKGLHVPAAKESGFHDQASTKKDRLISADSTSTPKSSLLDLSDGGCYPDELATEKDHSESTNDVHERSSPWGDRTRVDGFGNEPGAMNSPEPSILDKVKHRLGRFLRHVLRHPRIATASPSDQAILRQEIEMFLLAHVTHIEDNLKFSQQDLALSKTEMFLSPKGTYYQWVHTTSAIDTSCPYSFAFFVCLISPRGSDCFKGARSKYLARDLCSHLAVMCRQYNDYGSIARDRIERNLNSINFPEFHATGAYSDGRQDADTIQKKEDDLKSTLFEIAEYERESLERASQCLEKLIPAKIANMLSLFIGVTDLYGQIYVARDIASRMGRSGGL